jgi:hypothetical protein
MLKMYFMLALQVMPFGLNLSITILPLLTSRLGVKDLPLPRMTPRYVKSHPNYFGCRWQKRHDGYLW